MKFYYVHEDSTHNEVSGTNQEVYESVCSLIEQERTLAGFIGVIDSEDKLRANLILWNYQGKFRAPLTKFIRKYRGIECMEKLSAQLREKNE